VGEFAVEQPIQAERQSPLTGNSICLFGQKAIVEQLVEDIALGRISSRQRLVEDELLERFGEKRHVVRQALVDLEQMGLVERVPNKGAVVQSYSPEKVRQIYDVRLSLESAAALAIPNTVDSGSVARLQEIQDYHHNAVDRSDVAAAFKTNVLFHRHLFSLCGNPFFVEAIETLARKCHAIRFYALMDPALRIRGAKEHQEMIDTLKQGDTKPLADLCMAHLTPCRDAYITARQI